MFDNTIIGAPVWVKPHIVYIDGYWRVSPLLRIAEKYSVRWDKAHQFTQNLNDMVYNERHGNTKQSSESA